MTTNLFEFIEFNINNTQNLPLYKEVAWDYEKNIPILENGTFKIVEGLEAIKTWIYKALQVDRYSKDIYSWNYGTEINKLVGKKYTPSLIQSEAQRYIKEVLLINPYIKNVTLSNSKFLEGRILELNLEIDTIYGKGQVVI